ncbi:MaoC family dehydratase N-terminal domain-containing protein [Pseudomonas putida]|uniref:MaoC family dehydratase N-terminal domain-containing protein n=1 Tax=Pseudomonas putida TaxID=303 RepID=UPI003466E2F8
MPDVAQCRGGKGPSALFAKATGQLDPVYLDEAAARQAGYRNIPVPPTFLFCLENDSPDPWELQRLLDLDLGRLLHGEQSFVYHRMACAGDVLTFEPRLSDIYSRRDGALEFFVRETRVTDAMGEHIADLRCVGVQPHDGGLV